MLTQVQVDKFARDWVNAWNVREIDQIMAHYDDTIVLVSPVARKLLGQAEIRGIDAVRDYFLKGLAAYPYLRFDLQEVMLGDESLVLFYTNQEGIRAGECMLLNENHKVIKMYAHYGEALNEK